MGDAVSGDAVGWRLWPDRSGSVASEYAVLAAIVAVLAIGGLLALSDAVGELFGYTGSEAGGAMAVTRPAPGP